MSTLNSIDSTDVQNTKMMDNFNKSQGSYNPAQWEYVLGFFRKHMDNDAAENFAESIFQVAKQSDTNVMDIVQTMESKTGLDLNSSLAYYLNAGRGNSSLLGADHLAQPNYYAGRTVLI